MNTLTTIKPRKKFVPHVHLKLKKRNKRKKITPAQKAEYKKYLLSGTWKLIREQAFEFYGRCCGLCGCTNNLEIHHKTYVNIYFETMADLMVLCDHCHKNHHYRENKERVNRNGRRSKYMQNPWYESSPVTYFPKRTTSSLLPVSPPA